MRKTGQEIYEEAMKQVPQPDIRIRLDETESRPLTPEEESAYGIGQVAPDND